MWLSTNPTTTPQNYIFLSVVILPIILINLKYKYAQKVHHLDKWKTMRQMLKQTHQIYILQTFLLYTYRL